MYKRKHMLEKKTYLHYSCKLLKPVFWNEELSQQEARTNWFQHFVYSIVALDTILRIQIDQNCYLFNVYNTAEWKMFYLVIFCYCNRITKEMVSAPNSQLSKRLDVIRSRDKSDWSRWVGNAGNWLKLVCIQSGTLCTVFQLCKFWDHRFSL